MEIEDKKEKNATTSNICHVCGRKGADKLCTCGRPICSECLALIKVCPLPPLEFRVASKGKQDFLILDEQNYS